MASQQIFNSNIAIETGDLWADPVYSKALSEYKRLITRLEETYGNIDLINEYRAYDLYDNGQIEFQNEESIESLTRALALFQEAAELKPDFVKAHIGIGSVYRAAVHYGWMEGEPSLANAEASFNRGNCLVFLGQYDDAIKAYELALEAKPDWPEAEQNLAIARARKEKLAPPDDDAGGTGGELAADEIVFENSDRMDNASSEQTVEQDGQSMSEEALRALWLRRVETRPADFLANRFAYQLAVQQNQAEDD